jgi:hypothetical protein
MRSSTLCAMFASTTKVKDRQRKVKPEGEDGFRFR